MTDATGAGSGRAEPARPSPSAVAAREVSA
jgi:hypothetical protein